MLEFITDIEVNKILENYVSQSVARGLMKDIREQYIEDIPHRLNEVFLLDVDSDYINNTSSHNDSGEDEITESSESEYDETGSDSDDDAVSYFLNKKR
jgi:hypothetical protein